MCLSFSFHCNDRPTDCATVASREASFAASVSTTVTFRATALLHLNQECWHEWRDQELP